MAFGEGASTMLAIMPLSRPKFPAERVSLQLFESRYRAMFKVVHSSRQQLFGIAYADQVNAMIETVGTVCRLRSFVPDPENKRILIDSVAVGRYRLRRIVSDKPFITAIVEDYCDTEPQSISEHAEHAMAEARVWSCMQDVQQLAEKLYGHLGPLSDVISNEVRRWSFTDSTARSLPKPTACDANSDAEENIWHQWSRPIDDDAAISEVERRQRFSFAIARALDLPVAEQQAMLELQDTIARLRAAEAALLDGRSYLAARSTLKDMF
eukprot:jgi/Chlat1/9205/Chrsp97S08407